MLCDEITCTHASNVGCNTSPTCFAAHIWEHVASARVLGRCAGYITFKFHQPVRASRAVLVANYCGTQELISISYEMHRKSDVCALLLCRIIPLFWGAHTSEVGRKNKSQQIQLPKFQSIRGQMIKPDTCDGFVCVCARERRFYHPF